MITIHLSISSEILYNIIFQDIFYTFLLPNGSSNTFSQGQEVMMHEHFATYQKAAIQIFLY